MRPVGAIDEDLWIIAVIRAACRRDGIPMPNMRRADELLDERLATAEGPAVQ